jgi:regulator of ribonuclease activity A
MQQTTCDLFDRFEQVARVPLLQLRRFGQHGAFSGRAITVKCFEDNSRVRELCDGPGNRQVLVIDGGASLRCALLGDVIARKAVQNGWAGLIVNGCIRDSEEINSLALGVQALGTTPRKSVRKDQGVVAVELEFGGVVWRQGDQIFADADGVLVLDAAAETGMAPLTSSS